MVTKAKDTAAALSGAGLILSGQVFDADAESLTIQTGGAHYEVLREDIINTEDLANVKTGEVVQVRVSPQARVIQKRLLNLEEVPGIMSGNLFGKRRGPNVIAVCRDCSECIVCEDCIDCAECSVCVCECGGQCIDCSDCLEPNLRGVSSQRTARFRRRFRSR